jgi:hypothetical protein
MSPPAPGGLYLEAPISITIKKGNKKMTEPKHISKSLSTLLVNPMVLDILDRTKDIEPIANIAAGFWDYDLFSRKPSPAYNEYGVFKGTDLDLACFLYALTGRGAVIKIPYYKSGTKKVKRADQMRISSEAQGAITGLVGNENFFKFSVQIIDQNVVGEDKVGDFRTYTLTDHEGNWSDQWRLIEFVPTLNENKFITENKLWTGNKIIFSNFAHPNRWTSFFGHYYVISKLAVDRLAENISYLNKTIKEILAEGIEYPEGEGPATKPPGTYEYGDTVSKKFRSFQAKIFVPELGLKGEYPKINHDQANLVATYQKAKRLKRLKSSLMFMTRATELAHFNNPDRMPAWIKNVEWEPGFREPGKRTDWERLKLFQPEPGKHSVSILKRTYEKAARVSAD